MYYLVVYFLIQGVWLSAEEANYHGWASMPYKTLKECIERRDFMNKNFDDKAKAKCLAPNT
jgi:hypothetical protein|tara:strand:+ start:8173 stop:8355 length:183 start_codon:yes stop_codon:yes gene_type:complete